MGDDRGDDVGDDVLERQRIREVVESWAVWRDAGDWDRFATLWGRDGWMTATWFQGPAPEFVAVSRRGFEAGARILHFLGGSSVDIVGSRAVAQTKMTISQRAAVHDVDVDVVCTGRFYDFLAVEDAAWKLVRRQPIYEKDRMDALQPGVALTLDAEVLDAFPVGYRHLAYLQLQGGHDIHPALPGLVGPEVELLYSEGAAWLAGSERPGEPL